jgi:quinol monooxygenase YgiN
MFVHIWRMRARKKRVEEYEKFGRQITLPSLKKIDGCLGAHFIRIFEARKPEYLWLVFWRDHKALEQARTNPLWREQIKRFEAGKFYKTIPLELVCEELDAFAAPATKAKRVAKAAKGSKAASAREPESGDSAAEASESAPAAGPKTMGPIPDGE